jgi:hypothetical protein
LSGNAHWKARQHALAGRPAFFLVVATQQVERHAAALHAHPAAHVLDHEIEGAVGDAADLLGAAGQLFVDAEIGERDGGNRFLVRTGFAGAATAA